MFDFSANADATDALRASFRRHASDPQIHLMIQCDQGRDIRPR